MLWVLGGAGSVSSEIFQDRVVFIFDFFFFFQAEDGIRDLIVTGVQTCALPIYTGRAVVRSAWNSSPRVTAKRAARAARQRRLNCGIASRSARCRRARRSGGRGRGAAAAPMRAG